MYSGVCKRVHSGRTGKSRKSESSCLEGTGGVDHNRGVEGNTGVVR